MTEPNRTMHFWWQIVTGALNGQCFVRSQCRRTPSSRESKKSSFWMDFVAKFARIRVDVEGGTWDRSRMWERVSVLLWFNFILLEDQEIYWCELRRLNSSSVFSGMSCYPLVSQGCVWREHRQCKGDGLGVCGEDTWLANRKEPIGSWS